MLTLAGLTYLFYYMGRGLVWPLVIALTCFQALYRAVVPFWNFFIGAVVVGCAIFALSVAYRILFGSSSNRSMMWRENVAAVIFLAAAGTVFVVVDFSASVILVSLTVAMFMVAMWSLPFADKGSVAGIFMLVNLSWMFPLTLMCYAWETPAYEPALFMVVPFGILLGIVGSSVIDK